MMHKNSFIKWLIALSKHIFLILLSFSLSLFLFSEVLLLGYRSTDKWYTIIFHKYFVFRGIIYWRTQFWQLYAAGVFITRKTTVSMSFTNILSNYRELNLTILASTYHYIPIHYTRYHIQKKHLMECVSQTFYLNDSKNK